MCRDEYCYFFSKVQKKQKVNVILIAFCFRSCCYFANDNNANIGVIQLITILN